MRRVEWLSSINVHGVLNEAARRSTPRRTGLFLVSCCREVAHCYGEGASLASWSLDLAEAWLQNQEGDRAALDFMRVGLSREDGSFGHAVYLATANPVGVGAFLSTFFGVIPDGYYAKRVRSFFGEIFVPPARPAWADDGDIQGVAKGVLEYREKNHSLDRGRLAVLADACLDAGAADGDAVVAALRSPGPHYLGWWAIDLILGVS